MNPIYGDLRDRRTAGTFALRGSDRIRRFATRPVVDRARAARSLDMPEKSGRSCVEGLQPGDPIGDCRAALLDHARELRCGVCAVPGVAPPGHAGGIFERDVEAAQVDDQAQVLDIRRPIFAVRVLSPARSRKPPRALVQAHRIGGDADRVCQLGDPLSSVVSAGLASVHHA
jgi:hypothetical protein